MKTPVSYVREWLPIYTINESTVDNSDSINVEIYKEDLIIYRNKLDEFLKLQFKLETMFKQMSE